MCAIVVDTNKKIYTQQTKQYKQISGADNKTKLFNIVPVVHKSVWAILELFK